MVVVDDARHVVLPPCAGHWPSLLEITDPVHVFRPHAYVIMRKEQIVAVPTRARALVEANGQQLSAQEEVTLAQQARTDRREFGAAETRVLRRKNAARQLMRTVRGIARGRAR